MSYHDTSIKTSYVYKTKTKKQGTPHSLSIAVSEFGKESKSTHVKQQKYSKPLGGVALKRYLRPIHFCRIRVLKEVQVVKMRKK